MLGEGKGFGCPGMGGKLLGNTIDAKWGRKIANRRQEKKLLRR